MKQILRAIVFFTLSLLFILVAACGVEDIRLDKFQKMAYKDKPAIVKIWAQVQGIVEFDTEQGAKVDEINFIGFSGSGFIINPTDMLSPMVMW